MSTQLSRLTERAQADKTIRFLTMAHLLTPEALLAAFQSLRKDRSAGMDRVTYADYERAAWTNVQQLHDRLVRHQYRRQPLRRVYIPKENGTERPISILCLEDKIVQRTTVETLNAVYEQDFVACSYGFQPGQGPHDTLDAVGRTICRGPMAYVLEGTFEATSTQSCEASSWRSSRDGLATGTSSA